MRFDFTKQRVLAVVAHPDDAEMLCAGTLARAREDGAAIGICVLCQGDKGQTEPVTENLAEVRQAEMATSAGVLGAELLVAGFADGELADMPETRGVLVEIIRQFRPTLMLAHASTDYHADHRAASALAESTSWFCASSGHITSSPSLDQPPALWWMDTVNMSDFSPHFFVDVSEYVELKRQMLRCHQSQLARGADANFSPLEELLLRQCTARGDQAGVKAAEAFRTHRAWKRTGAW